MPRTSPIAHPVKQCNVADAALDQATEDHPRFVGWPAA
jgi:hypothetical protein